MYSWALDLLWLQQIPLHQFYFLTKWDHLLFSCSNLEVYVLILCFPNPLCISPQQALWMHASNHVPVLSAVTMSPFRCYCWSYICLTCQSIRHSPGSVSKRANQIMSLVKSPHILPISGLIKSNDLVLTQPSSWTHLLTVWSSDTFQILFLLQDFFGILELRFSHFKCTYLHLAANLPPVRSFFPKILAKLDL